MIKETGKNFIRAFLIAIAILICGPAAASPVFAEDAVDLQVKFTAGGADTREMTFRLYQVGTVDNAVYSLDEPYSESGVNTDFTPETSWEQWKASGTTLYQYIKTHDLADGFIQEVQPDEEGLMTVSVEPWKLYLIASDDEVRNGDIIYSAPATYLWYIQGDEDAFFIKPEETPVVKTEYTVVKHWAGDTPQDRPASIKVALYENDALVETVELNQKNNWTYTWQVEDTEGEWSCLEQTVPEGYEYTGMTKEDGAKFILTNTWVGNPDTDPDKDTDRKDDPSDTDSKKKRKSNSSSNSNNNSNSSNSSSQSRGTRTGDPTTYRWSVIAMIFSGLAMIVIASRRRQRD